MKKLVKLLNCYAFIMLISICFGASAYASYLEYSGIDHSDRLNIDFIFNDNGLNATIGKMNIDLDGYDPVAFCIEIGASTDSGYVTSEDPSDYWDEYNNNGLYAAWLMDQYTPYLGFDYSSLSDQSFTNFTLFDESLAYSALQISIWDTLYNYDSTNNSHSRAFFSDGMENGSSQRGGDAEQLAWDVAAYYSQTLRAVMADAQSKSIDDFFSPNRIFAVADFNPNDNTHGNEPGQELLISKPVPEPATILLFGIGLLGIGALGRKRRI